MSLQVKVLKRVWTGRICFLKVQLKPTGGCICLTSHTHGHKRTQLCILCVHLETKHTSQCGAIQTIQFTQLGVIPTPNITIC